MFIGHFAVGFAAKRFYPRGSEAVLLSAPLLADILWPVFLLLGWEQVRIDPGNTRFTPFVWRHSPCDHTLLGGRDRDLGGARYGLGLWNSIAGAMVVEILMFAAGVWMYARATRAKDRIGRYAFLAYIVLLLLIYVANAFGTAPASVPEVAWAALALPAVGIPGAWWFDRHRSSGGEQA